MFVKKDSRGSIMTITKTFLGVAAAASVLCFASIEQARAEGPAGVSKDAAVSSSLIIKVEGETHSRRESRRSEERREMREERRERERMRDEEEQERRYCKDLLAVAGRGRPFEGGARENAIKLWRSEALLKWGQEYADYDFAKRKTIQCYKVGDFGWKKCEVKAFPCRPRPQRDN